MNSTPADSKARCTAARLLERVLGELYCLAIGSGDRQRLAIVELIRGFGQRTEAAAAGVWYAFNFSPTVKLGRGRQTRMIDGPLHFDGWPEKCRGRVVGVMVPL